MILVLAGLLAGAAQQPSPPPPPASASADANRKVPALDARLNNAFRLIKAGHYAAARQAAQDYLGSGNATHPGQAHFILGLSYHRQRLYENARGRFAEAVALEPGYVTA